MSSDKFRHHLLTSSPMFPQDRDMTTKTSELQREERVRIGATLKTLRLLRGWRADDFANEIGISRPYLSNIEAGRKPITNPILANAAKALDVEQIAIARPIEHGAAA